MSLLNSFLSLGYDLFQIPRADFLSLLLRYCTNSVISRFGKIGAESPIIRSYLPGDWFRQINASFLTLLFITLSMHSKAA